MSKYVQECLNKASVLPEDEAVKAYKRKITKRLRVSKILLSGYMFSFSAPFLFNIIDFINSRKLSAIVELNRHDMHFFMIAFMFLLASIKLKNGSSFYQLPFIKQTLGKKQINTNDNAYLKALSGNTNLLSDVKFSLYKLDCMNSSEPNKSEMRIIEDCIISRRANERRKQHA